MPLADQHNKSCLCQSLGRTTSIVMHNSTRQGISKLGRYSSNIMCRRNTSGGACGPHFRVGTRRLFHYRILFGSRFFHDLHHSYTSLDLLHRRSFVRSCGRVFITICRVILLFKLLHFCFSEFPLFVKSNFFATFMAIPKNEQEDCSKLVMGMSEGLAIAYQTVPATREHSCP